MSARPAPEDTAEPQLAAGAAAESQPTVDAQHPWLGLASFTEETRGYFHGREEEVAELARRVQRKLLTVLFGQSGLGKTSILRAGIVPRLRPEGYCPVYVRVDYSPESPPPSEQIKQAIFRATEASGQWTKPGVSSEGESLWEFLHHRDDLLLDAGGRPVIPLLIFDQFEEIFTLAQADDAGRQRAAQFVDDLADLVENRLPKALEAKLDQDDSITERFDFGRADYRILIALREDYLAHLESVKGVMPSITQNRMRLARMNGQQALAAVLKPGGRLVSQEVAESIVRFIAGGSELRNAEVEPSLLSLICRELNNTRIAQGRAEISADLLAGSHDTILAEFYERALADQPAAVRKVIEDQLLTESGFRESLAEERLLKAFADAGAAPDALATLVNRRLLRIEERLDVRRVELTHDVLCGVVKASRQLRMEREALEEAERRLAEQRSREAATRKALVRARQIAAGCAVLAVVAVVGAIFGYVNMQRARQAEASALDSRRLAEGARGEAEKLVVFLLEDFQLELEPIGRLDIVASLSKRALDYYAGLPAELRTPATERNRALAEVRYAISLRNLGRLDEALQAAGSAEDTLRRLRDGGDASEPTLIGLAMATHARARALSQKGVFDDSRRASTQAHDMLRPVVEAHGASVAVRRAFGEVSIQHGFNVLRASDFEQAVPIFEQARTALRSIDGLKLADLSSAALFVEVTAWQMDALMPLGRIDEARRIAEEARPVADGVIEKQPGHMMALRARALLMSNFADLSNHQLRLHAALPYYAAVARDYEALLKVDPGNLIAWNNLGGTLLSLGLLTEASGRPREGLRHLRAAAATGRQGGMTSVRAGNIADMWFHVARVEADLGNPEAARAALAEAARYIDIVVREAPAGSFRRLMYEPWMPVAEAQVLLNLNDFPGARAKGEAAAKQLETVRPQSDSERAFLGVQLSDAWWAAAQSAYLTRDYAIAEPAARRAVEVRTSTPAQNKFEEVWRAEYRALHAMALTKLGRIAEARTALEPAVRYHASLPALDEAEWVRVRRAPVRLAQALVTPAQAQALLGEAAQLLENLPPELRATNSIIQLRNEIAIEQGRRR